jgi:hypothetical protein
MESIELPYNFSYFLNTCEICPFILWEEKLDFKIMITGYYFDIFCKDVNLSLCRTN